MGKNAVTSREQSTGKKNGGVNIKSMLKIDHLKSLSTWASSEVCIPSLGAFFGQRLATTAEALGVPPDPSLFPCQRCESLLQPGCSCTVRVVKIKAKAKRKNRLCTQNSVVYKCHFCSHENRKRGTPKGHMKKLCPPKPKLQSKSKLTSYAPVKCLEPEVKLISKDDLMSMKDQHPSSAITSSDQADSCPVMSNDDPLSKNGVHPLSVIISNDQAVSCPVMSNDDPVSKIGVDLSSAVTRIDQAVICTAMSKDDQMSKKDEHPSSAILINDRAVSCTDMIKDEMSKKDEHYSPAMTSNDQAAVSCPATPTTKITTLLDSAKKKRNRSKSKKAAEPESSSVAIDAGKSGTTSRKRRRKTWTSLKEIAERNEQNYSLNLANLSIPFHL
ncbi:OLC1v1009696C1 [Oldenlandia corymbosa var. corymbosa]|uniref:OLC1v1009696C1 n=1 Tax=Oldenlandia corymbosa var. corymbosa TaxID=529605 RepID=A0AAV1DPR6_OLDCO|nr:OLC1v1009696C1 [Oldenlandia corymbosa var. corymbosa]